jgi:methionine salvage enolase-phosphatase E1
LATNDVLVGTGRSRMVFVSADEDLLRAAQDEGMATDNPNRQGNQH